MSEHMQSPLDRSLPITFFSSFAAAEKREEHCTLRNLGDRIRGTTARDKGRLPWLKLAKFGDLRSDKNSLRHDANILVVSGIEADYDGEQISVERAVELLEERGIAAVVYTSPSHSDTAPRWRILCPFSEDLPPDKRAHMLGRLNGLLGGVLSDESFTLSQSYYFGSVNRNPAHRVELIDGSPIDLHDDLDEVWRGKPNTNGSASNGHDKSHHGPLDEPGLLGEIVSGKNFHRAAIRLLGRWAFQGVPMVDARQRLRRAFESVFPPDRDERWQRRFDDIDRCVGDVYGKEANKRDETAGGEQTNQERGGGISTPELRDLLSIGTWINRDIPEPDRLLGDLFTTTTRTMLIGSTGLGKTMLGLALALAMACGTSFLHWRPGRPARTLYVDAEMPGELIKSRCLDALRRADNPQPEGELFIFGRDLEEEVARLFPTLGKLEPVNTEAGRNWLLALIDMLGGVDAVIFDNVMSLTIGDKKEEATWNDVLPLVATLTAKRIGQVWIDHTGHDTGRVYGTSTKTWRFDSVAVMTPLPDDERRGADVAFLLTFTKARRRTPDNRADFEPVTIRLEGDRWTGGAASADKGAGKLPPSRVPFHEALVAAIGKSTIGPDRTLLTSWELECLRRGLIEKPPSDGKREPWRQRDARFRDFRKAKSDLQTAKWIAIEGDVVMDLRGRWE